MLLHSEIVSDRQSLLGVTPRSPSGWQHSLSLGRLRIDIQHVRPVSGELRLCDLPRVSRSESSIHSQRTVETRTRAQADKVSAAECWCPLLLCVGSCGCVKWIMAAVSNRCYPPQGGQGPKWSDIRLGASAGLIQRYVSDGPDFHPPSLSTSTPSLSLWIPPAISYLFVASHRSPPPFDLSNCQDDAGYGLWFWFFILEGLVNKKKCFCFCPRATGKKMKKVKGPLVQFQR